VTDAERKAFDAMFDALCSINEVDDFGDGYATVNIDYERVTEALDLVEKLRRQPA
jgi:hypothetical protein